MTIRNVKGLLGPVLAVAVAVALFAGCSARGPARHTSAAGPRAPASASPSPSSLAGLADDPYVHLADALHRRGVEIWFETDLVSPWLQGPGVFDRTVARLGQLATTPGVTGFKVADELGYHDGLSSPEQTRQFLTDVHRALARAAPGAQVLVDAIVPELGCLPWRGAPERACATRAEEDYPAATQQAMSSYLRAGLVDRLDLSTGLLDASTYSSWGVTQREAQREAWAHVGASDWPTLTRLQARKALADPGGYAGTVQDAADDVATYVDVPSADGAHAVDVWTWRQQYDGRTVSLLAGDLSPNPLWSALQRRRAGGVHLFTHMTPSNMPTDPAAFAKECDTAAAVFTAVFVAAGTG